MQIAAAIAALMALSGAVAWAVGTELLGLDDEQLVTLVTVASGAGAVLGGVFAAPIFGAGLTQWLLPSPPPIPTPEELERWCVVLRAAVLERRVLGAGSQREQMLRKGVLIDLPVTPNVNLHSGPTGRPRVSLSPATEPWSQLREHWMEAKGRLVILGDPGYGKTLAALALVAHVNHHDERHIAELFPLVDWYAWSAGREDAPIDKWLVDQLTQTYRELTRSTARGMLAHGLLVPVFDGLDEVPEHARPDCRDAIDAYAGRGESFRPFVVTCRHAEYLALAPVWVGADQHVALPGLDGPEIARVLHDATAGSKRWRTVVEAVEAGDARLVALLKSPLRLVAAIEAYETRDPAELVALAARPDAGEELWNLLLAVDHRVIDGASSEDVRRWLGFIASSLQSHDRQRLWLHELYLYVSPADRRRFRLLAAAMYTALVATPAAFLPDTRFGALIGGLVAGLVLVAASVNYRRERDIPVEYTVPGRLSFSRYRKAVPGIFVSSLVLAAMLASAGAVVLFAAAVAASVLAGEGVSVGVLFRAIVEVALWLGVLTGLVMFALSLSGLGSSEVDDEPPASVAGQGPDAVLRATRSYGVLVIAVVVAVYFGPVLVWVGDFWFAAAMTAVSGITLGWMSGLGAWAFYHWSCWRLSRAGLVPFRLQRFLDWASADTGWLRASDAYEFRHRELLDHLAREVQPVGVGNLSYAEALAARADRGTAQAEARRGARLARAQDFPGALAAYSAAARAAPNDARIRSALSDVLDTLDQDLFGVQAHTSRGVAYGQIHGFVRALEHARLAAEAEPADLQCNINLAVALSMLGRDDEALGVVNDALVEAPADDRLRELGEALREIVERRDRHFAAARSAIERDPDDAAAHLSLAARERMYGNAPAAARMRQRAVDLACQAAIDPATAARVSHVIWDLNVAGYCSDAARISEHLADTEPFERLCGLAQASAGFGRAAEAGGLLLDIRRMAQSPNQLNSLANVLIACDRSADAVSVIKEAMEDRPEELVYAFTHVEALLVGGDLTTTREHLAAGLERSRRDNLVGGDIPWMCRLAWLRPSSERAAIVAMLVEEYARVRGLLALASGLVVATPTSPAQAGFDRERLEDWYAMWGRDRAMRRAIGVMQGLVEEEARDGSGIASDLAADGHASGEHVVHAATAGVEEDGDEAGKDRDRAEHQSN